MAERKIQIEQVENGYILTGDDVLHARHVYLSLEEAMNAVLHHFEWRSPHGDGERYGGVEIHRMKTE